MDTIEYTSVGQRVRQLRDKKGWTQIDLSKSSRIPQPDISSIEQDKLNIGLKRARMLARALEAPITEFLHEEVL